MRSDKRWEYKALTLKSGNWTYGDAYNAEIEQQLNQLGNQGWELVNIIWHSPAIKPRAIFKR